MQLTHPHPLSRISRGKFKSKAERKNGSAVHANVSQSAREEINAYIAIRNNLLADAERSPTRQTLATAALANDFVESCLRSPRLAYQAQHLRESDVACERKLCRKVKQRIAQLTATIV